MTDFVALTTPLNIADEKQKFFASETYNPQLEYREPIDLTQLQNWGTPQPHLVEHAQRFIELYGQQKHPKDSTEIITSDEINQAVAEFNQTHDFQTPVEAVFSENLVAKCKVSGHKIYFHLPISYTRSQFADLYRHELETHLLRSFNHSLQPWKDVKTPELQIRRTEEGWAGLHTFLYRENKILLKSYVTYLAVQLAQNHSFREVFTQLRSVGVTKDLAWRITLRTKRGLQDTSQPGGLTKDICYLEGAIQVWNWLIKAGNDPRDCYLGRLSLEDVPIYKPQAKLESVRYPQFMSNPDKYLAHIREIGNVNMFDSLI